MALSIDLIELRDNYAEFEISGVDVSVVNGLRRAMMAEVPVWAIDEVYISNNTTIFPEEYISQRLAMIPIKAAEGSCGEGSCGEGSCGEGSCGERSDDPKEYMFTLNKTASLSDIIETWYSDDLESTDPDCSVAIPRIPLVKVNKGQQLHLTAIVKKGCGRQHSKWCAVSTCFFRKVKNRDNTFLFKVETNLSMYAKEVLLKSVRSLREKIEGCEEKMVTNVLG